MSQDKLMELSEEDESAILAQIKDYMQDEFDLALGNLQAKMMLDFIIDSIGPKLYDQVIDDIEPWFYSRFTGILEDLHALKKD